MEFVLQYRNQAVFLSDRFSEASSRCFTSHERILLLGLPRSMKCWPVLSLFLLAAPSALPAQDVAAREKLGENALASGLWSVAQRHFSDCLASPDLTAATKQTVALRLAEALIRDSKPKEALECLQLSFLEKNPETLFWKAQAIAACGRFSEATDLFSKLLSEPNAPHRYEAVFSQASLFLSLGKPDAALKILATLSGSPNPETAAHAAMSQTEILLDLGRNTEARAAMPLPDQIPTKDRQLVSFLEANLLLAEHHFNEAATAFRQLVSQPQGQSLASYHNAAIGLADALDGGGNRDEATKSLLSFIQDHPDSPALEAMFKRLQLWLPKSPTITNPILEQLAQWITPPKLRAYGLIAVSQPNNDAAAISAWPPEENSGSDLLVFSMFTRAIGLHRIATPESKAEAFRLMTRLRIENAGHFLANRALYQTARWLLEDGNSKRAFDILETLHRIANSPILAGEAGFLEARTAYENGDPKLAIRLFDQSAKELRGLSAKVSRLNAGLARLTSGDLPGVLLILHSTDPTDVAIQTDLDLERALTISSPAEKQKALEAFLAKCPDDPRAPEARLAAAEAALANSTPNLDFARIQLDILEKNRNANSALSPAKLALVQLRLADLSRNSDTAIALARSILESYPNDPVAADAALTLGRNLFEEKDYNPARLVLEKLAASDTDSGRAQVAWLLAARAAALVGTTSSKDEALVLFDKAIALAGPLVAIARLEKADHLIKSMYRFNEAATFLKTWFDSMPTNDPLRLPAGLLLGQALYAQGGATPDSLAQALNVYDELLPHAEKHPALVHRLEYLRGLALEQLPDEKDPSKKRVEEAFNAYYSVLETTSPPTEWEFFELCGFKSLSLLEKAENWPAAIACAKKISSFRGPRAAEAATRASQLQLKHMIWDD